MLAGRLALVLGRPMLVGHLHCLCSPSAALLAAAMVSIFDAICSENKNISAKKWYGSNKKIAQFQQK